MKTKQRLQESLKQVETTLATLDAQIQAEIQSPKNSSILTQLLVDHGIYFGQKLGLEEALFYIDFHAEIV